MRLETLTVRGIGPIKGEVQVDLSTAQGPIVAICGANGAGKTTLLECFAGAVSPKLKMPSRGLLKHMAVARDSMVETTIVNGSRYTVRHLLDGVSGNGESLVLDTSGAPMLESSKVSDFKTWASRHFPDEDVFLASVFASQGQSNLITATDGARKAILLRALGLEKLERLAKEARDRATAASSKLALVVARLEELGDVDVEAAEQALADASGVAIFEEAKLTEARGVLESARAKRAEADRTWERRCDQVARRAELRERIEKAELDVKAAEAQLGRAQQEVTDLDTKIANNQRVLDNRVAIEDAVQRREVLAVEIAKLEAELQSLSTKAVAAGKEVARLERDRSEARKRHAQVAQRIDRLLQEVERASKAEAAAKELPKRHAELETARAELASAEAALEILRGQRLAGADERIEGMRGALTQIGEADGEIGDPGATVAGIARLARHTIRIDDEVVELASMLPSRVQDALERVARLRTEADEAAIAVSSCAELAVLADRAEDDRRALVEAQQQARDEEYRIDELGRQIEVHKQDQLTIADKRDATDRRLGDLRHEHAGLEDLASKAAPLALAEQRIADRTAQREQAKERAGEVEERLARCRTLVVELRKTLAGLPEPEEVPPAPSDAEVNALASEADRTETAARNAHGAVSVTENAVEAAKAASARAQELEGERKRVEADLSDWKRLAADLGRDGLQAAEIDCAGPELTELTNDLLHNCVGTRYSVRVETTKLDSKGKRELEGLPITAVDTENGHEGDVRGFSGGQRVLIGEALSLALTMLVARRAGLEGLTIVRDETGAALSPENSRAYVDMLRRAAAIVGADKVLLVSHNPDVWEMADSRIEVRDGGIHIH